MTLAQDQIKTVKLKQGDSFQEVVLPPKGSIFSLINNERSKDARSVSQEEARALVNASGGIFIGKEELVRLRAISPETEIPNIPEKFSAQFLESLDPIDRFSAPGKSRILYTVAANVILAYEPRGQRWHCIERFLPHASFRLSAYSQDRLLFHKGKRIRVEGVKAIAPKDAQATFNVIGLARQIVKERIESIKTDGPDLRAAEYDLKCLLDRDLGRTGEKTRRPYLRGATYKYYEGDYRIVGGNFSDLGNIRYAFNWLNIRDIENREGEKNLGLIIGWE